jgi:hypothetical protein
MSNRCMIPGLGHCLGGLASSSGNLAGALMTQRLIRHTAFILGHPCAGCAGLAMVQDERSVNPAPPIFGDSFAISGG